MAKTIIQKVVFKNTPLLLLETLEKIFFRKNKKK